MVFSFEDHAYNKLLKRFGIVGDGRKETFFRVVIPLLICWLPLALVTLAQGTFWTGDVKTSFITHFDTQARLLISIPILIVAGGIVGKGLNIVLDQFKSSGIIRESDHSKFDKIISGSNQFLQSYWTDIVIIILVYVHGISVVFYESEHTSFLTWQLAADGEKLNLAGKWNTLISRPFFLFLFYRWLLALIVWGVIMRKISRLNLNLFTFHPDRCGGLGFLGYGIQYFSIVAFAFSATIAGNMVDFMIIEGLHISDLRIQTILYVLLLSILFTVPMFSFTRKLIDLREKGVFENYDFANGMYRELRNKVSKRYEEVNHKDLENPAYSSVADYNAIIENGIKMKFVPFVIKDMVPVWIMAALPFLAVVLVEIPVFELLQKVMSFLF